MPVRRPGGSRGEPRRVDSACGSAPSRAPCGPDPGTDWRRAADRTLNLVHAVGDPCAGFQASAFSWARCSVVRSFELWTHDNDIRRAAGLPPSVPDASALHLMTGLAARLLPHAAARRGLRGPVDVHLVLTGPGGGTWDVDIGERLPDPASILIVTNAVGFCRLVATGSLPPTLTCTSPATPAGPPGYSPRPLHWPWTKSSLALD